MGLCRGLFYLHPLMSLESLELWSNLGFLTMSSLALLSSSRSRFLPLFININTTQIFFFCIEFCVWDLFFYFSHFLLHFLLLLFAEISAWIFGCFILWIILCCFCAFLHCFSSFALLGMLYLFLFRGYFGFYCCFGNN